MKYFILILGLLVSTLNSGQVKHQYSDLELENLVFQEFDQLLMKTWIDAKQKKSSNFTQYNNQINSEWQRIKKQIRSIELPHVDNKEFIKDLDYFMTLLDKSSSISDYNNVEKLSYHIMYEFRSLRQCYFYSEYPLDQLWDVIDVHSEIDFTIDDPMMDLKEWFEFEDMVNLMICNWETYDLLHISEIDGFFMGFNKEKHNAIKERVNSCIFSLLKAIETSFQDNFESPCDELGYALEDLIKLYAYTRPSGLM
ncbi:MAG: hypothetical protein HKO66_02140 [Saprospiraceae bacterium]|nr:hypothetical protein [Bacteroidia bacterium]NNL91012.1 hypothetical protein [Saprospiraceae bacterium]